MYYGSIMFNPNSFSDKKPAFADFQESSTYNWKIDNMPWKTQKIMMFNGIPIEPSTTTSSQMPRKRKNELVNPSPSKQHITETKMSEFLNGLHISNDYQSHDISLENNFVDDEEMESTYKVNLSPQELEQRLKTAQRIILCDSVKKSLEENSKNEIFKVLSEKIEKPCQALVLWKPPKPLEDLILTNFNNNTNKTDRKDNDEETMIFE